MFVNFSFMTPYLGWVSIPNSFVSLFIFYILSYLLLKRMGYFLGTWCPPPAFRSCFVEFAQRSNDLSMTLWVSPQLGMKVVSPSYSSVILGPLPLKILKKK